MAAILTSEGDPERAVEFLGLVLHHPATHQMDRDRAQALLSQLEPELPPEAFAEALERGRTLELEEVVTEILSSDQRSRP